MPNRSAQCLARAGRIGVSQGLERSEVRRSPPETVHEPAEERIHELAGRRLREIALELER